MLYLLLLRSLVPSRRPGHPFQDPWAFRKPGLPGVGFTEEWLIDERSAGNLSGLFDLPITPLVQAACPPDLKNKKTHFHENKPVGLWS